MESNWRLNIWGLGMTTVQAKLIARLRNPLGFFTHIGSFEFDIPGLYRYVFDGDLIFPGTDAPWLFNSTPTVGEPTFPGGFDVFPDSPN